MPYKPSRQCPGRGPNTNRCPNLAKGKDSYCLECMEYLKHDLKKHRKAYDKERDQTRERKFIHSPRWRKIRLRKLAQDPLCEMCLEEGMERMACIVHHIDGNELNNDPSNHLSTCFDCHLEIHKNDAFGRKKKE